MRDVNREPRLFIRLRFFFWLLSGLWTGCVAGSLLWNLRQQASHSVEMARHTAQIAFENDLLYRRWAAMQGGVYVRVSENTPPNPYLEDPERDLTTNSGLALTSVNPAYMARQVNSLIDGRGGSRGHLTSLKPIRPENAPDPWEAAALRSFEEGVAEVSSIEAMPDGEFLRLMRPFVVERACLKCHAAQGYRVGDVRGGLSVAVPMASLRAVEASMATRLALAHLGLWLVGLSGIVIFRRTLGKEILARQRTDEDLRESDQRVRRKLASVLDPEGDLGTLELADLIDVEAIQGLMDEFYHVAHIPMSILDARGQVLVGVGWQEICTDFHCAHPETRRRCLESDMELTSNLAEGEFRMVRCKNCMRDMATPIFVGGRCVGGIFSGQFFFEDEIPDRELFRTQARRYGFSEEAYLAALDRVPRLTHEAVDRGMAFFSRLAAMLSQLGYSHIKLARLLAERDRLLGQVVEGEQRLKRAQAIAHLGSWEHDLVTNTVSWSDEVYEIFGIEPSESVATYDTFLNRVHPDDRAAVIEAYARSVREGSDSYTIEHRVVRGHTAEIRWVEERCQHVRDSDGRIIASLGMVLDITDRKRAEESLAAAKAAAEAANAAKSQFLANVSHELRTPMNAILGMIDVALPKAVDPTIRDCLQTAKESADLLLTLLNDLLDSAKIESGKLQLESAPFSLRRMLDRTARVLAVRASEKGLAFYCRMPGTTPDLVIGDQMRLQQVLLNLAGNAIKFTEHGDVEISVNALSQADQACLEFTVRDTGIGLSADDLERLFQPFTQADVSMSRRFGGTGLGLSIAESLVRLMGGTISVESELGKGSIFRFTVRLPLANELLPDLEAPAAILPAACLPLRILLVEDNPANQKLASYILQDRGHQVAVAGDGREAICLAGQDRYDVILMDVQMPGMNGLEAAASIREKQQPGNHVPIIAMTAHAMEGDRQRCLAAGMDGYLSKPVNAHEMIRLVESLARRAAPPVGPAAATLEPADTAAPKLTTVYNPGEALAQCWNSQELLREMIQHFFRESDSLLGRMRAALEQDDLAKVGELGHRLKGTILYLGAQPAEQAVRRVERFYNAYCGNRSEAVQAINALQQECTLLKAAIAEHPLAVESRQSD